MSICNGSHLNSNDTASIRKALDDIRKNVCYLYSQAIVSQSYTTTERDALTGMAAGTLIFNSTTSKLNFYTGSAWAVITSV